MTTIRITEQVGPFCGTVEQGEKVNALIREALDRREDVMLDFTGVRTLTGSFLMDAIGGLYASYDQGFLEEKLGLAGHDPVIENVVRGVRQKAMFFYSKTAEQQDALVAAALRHGIEE